MMKFRAATRVAIAKQIAKRAGLALLPDYSGGYVVVTQEQAATIRAAPDYLEALATVMPAGNSYPHNRHSPTKGTDNP